MVFRLTSAIALAILAFVNSAQAANVQGVWFTNSYSDAACTTAKTVGVVTVVSDTTNGPCTAATANQAPTCAAATSPLTGGFGTTTVGACTSTPTDSSTYASSLFGSTPYVGVVVYAAAGCAAPTAAAASENRGYFLVADGSCVTFASAAAGPLTSNSNNYLSGKALLQAGTYTVSLYPNTACGGTPVVVTQTAASAAATCATNPPTGITQMRFLISSTAPSSTMVGTTLYKTTSTTCDATSGVIGFSSVTSSAACTAVTTCTADSALKAEYKTVACAVSGTSTAAAAAALGKAPAGYVGLIDYGSDTTCAAASEQYSSWVIADGTCVALAGGSNSMKATIGTDGKATANFYTSQDCSGTAVTFGPAAATKCLTVGSANKGLVIVQGTASSTTAAAAPTSTLKVNAARSGREGALAAVGLGAAAAVALIGA